MKQFSLEEFLKNLSRKVVTRDGRPVRIICTNAKRTGLLIALVEKNGEDYVYSYLPIEIAEELNAQVVYHTPTFNIIKIG